MNIERVNYQRTFNLGSYESVRIGAEVMVNAGEDAKQALVIAKNFVEEFQKENHPHTYGHDSTPDIPIIPKSFNVSHEPPNHSNKELIDWAEQIERQPVDLKKEIQSSTSLKVLESYKFIVKGKPELEKVYTDKLHEITVTHDRPKEFINQ